MYMTFPALILNKRVRINHKNDDEQCFNEILKRSDLRKASMTLNFILCKINTVRFKEDLNFCPYHKYRLKKIFVKRKI